MKKQLSDGLKKLNIEFNDSQIRLCLKYIQLLIKWNKAFNLTAIRQPKKMVSHLLLDSLSLLPYLEDKQKIMDVGSGAGLPGLPLAIFMPKTDWVLCDSNGKKTRFIRQACAELGLKNISVENKRIEDYHHAQSFDVILSKAYASLSDFVQSTRHLCSAQTILLTLKTGLQEQQKKGAYLSQHHLHLEEIFLMVPGIDEPRSIVTIKSN